MFRKKPDNISKAHWEGKCDSCVDCQNVLVKILLDGAKQAEQEEQDRIIRLTSLALVKHLEKKSTLSDAFIDLLTAINKNHPQVLKAVANASLGDEKNG
jgi:hypothetical protein